MEFQVKVLFLTFILTVVLSFVIIPILNKYNVMLYKKLIYTAVTRAKKKLILIGELSALEKAILNDKENIRKTSLKDFIISCIK